MKSLRFLYRIGHGPSSSHSMGPFDSCLCLKNRYKDIKKVTAILYGSLALTGKGHLTDKNIVDAFYPIPAEVVFDFKEKVAFPNTFDVILDLEKDKKIHRVCSLGGGRFSIDGISEDEGGDVYKEASMADVLSFCKKNEIKLDEYVYLNEGSGIKDYLGGVLDAMFASIERGLQTNGDLPGKLGVKRKANLFVKPNHENESQTSESYRLLSGYAFAVAEENASGNIVVTAPTCGSSGVLPSVLKFNQVRYGDSKEKLIDALAVAGIVGNIIKTNGSISGAEAGCQAEIGSATAMAGAAHAYLRGLSNEQIIQAAEIALEHSLGLTCDPVGGYVQIPCIERNAVGAAKAVSSAFIAEFSSLSSFVSFDNVVKTMLETGKDINNKYRETAKGGLASTLGEKK